jgi:tripartite-type tricarboxylate transporter receptor subunit TctC
MITWKSTLTLASLLTAFTVSNHAVQAADYPAGLVKIVVPYPAGGPNDFIARIVAQKLSEKLRAQFIVENLPGAGGEIGTAAVARAAADGRTIALVNPGFRHRSDRQGQRLVRSVQQLYAGD